MGAGGQCHYCGKTSDRCECPDPVGDLMKARAEVKALRARNAELEEWRAKALEFLHLAAVPRHVFRPDGFGSDWCGYCGGNLRHPSHYRDGDSPEADRDAARALIDAAREKGGTE